jgi:hypothetical protein
MLPELNVHSPRGALPRIALHRRTVVEYQPGWLILALPAALVLASRRRSPRDEQTVLASPTADMTDAVAPHAEARGRRLPGALSALGLRRRPVTPGGPTDGQIADIREAASSVRGVPLP